MVDLREGIAIFSSGKPWKKGIAYVGMPNIIGVFLFAPQG